MSQVIIKVGKKGETSIEVKGVAGGHCTTASAPYKAKLAGEVVSDKPTEEMNQAPLSQEEHEEENL
jgi:hypothetical protein